MMILTIQIYGHTECITLFSVELAQNAHLENDKKCSNL